MSARRALAVAAAALPLLLGAACAGSSAGSSGATTTTAAGTTAAVTTTTAQPTTTKPTMPTTVAQVPAPTRDAAMGRLMDAWKAGDRVAAAKIADPQSVANLFTQSPDGFSLQGCDTGEFDTSNCNYRNRSKGYFAAITAEKRSGGWVVTGVYVATDG